MPGPGSLPSSASPLWETQKGAHRVRRAGDSDGGRGRETDAERLGPELRDRLFLEGPGQPCNIRSDPTCSTATLLHPARTFATCRPDRALRDCPRLLTPAIAPIAVPAHLESSARGCRLLQWTAPHLLSARSRRRDCSDLPARLRCVRISCPLHPSGLLQPQARCYAEVPEVAQALLTRATHTPHPHTLSLKHTHVQTMASKSSDWDECARDQRRLVTAQASCTSSSSSNYRRTCLRHHWREAAALGYGAVV
jgi:hypothetical protein